MSTRRKKSCCVKISSGCLLEIHLSTTQQITLFRALIVLFLFEGTRTRCVRTAVVFDYNHRFNQEKKVFFTNCFCFAESD